MAAFHGDFSSSSLNRSCRREESSGVERRERQKVSETKAGSGAAQCRTAGGPGIAACGARTRADTHAKTHTDPYSNDADMSIYIWLKASVFTGMCHYVWCGTERRDKQRKDDGGVQIF